MSNLSFKCDSSEETISQFGYVWCQIPSKILAGYYGILGLYKRRQTGYVSFKHDLNAYVWIPSKIFIMKNEDMLGVYISFKWNKEGKPVIGRLWWKMKTCWVYIKSRINHDYVYLSFKFCSMLNTISHIWICS